MSKSFNNKYMNHPNQPHRKSENYELHIDSKNKIPYKSD